MKESLCSLVSLNLILAVALDRRPRKTIEAMLLLITVRHFFVVCNILETLDTDLEMLPDAGSSLASSSRETSTENNQRHAIVDNGASFLSCGF